MRRLLPLLLSSACAGFDLPEGFVPWAPPPASDPSTVRLCAGTDDPEALADKQQLDCALAGGLYAAHPSRPVDALRVAAFNIERGFEVDAILAAIAAGDLPDADVWLLSEVDRGCARTDRCDIARDLAEALALDFAYGVEFVELTWGDDGRLADACEHGNAVLSRVPLGDVAHTFLAAQATWYAGPEVEDPDEPRLGGRAVVTADLAVGDGRAVQVHALHLESKVEAILGGIQRAQAAEVVAAAAVGRPVIAGGDLNTGFYAADVAGGTRNDATVATFLDAGFVDAHAGLPADARLTHGTLLLDLLLGRDVVARDPWVCPPDVCGGLSDHQAIAATFDLGR